MRNFSIVVLFFLLCSFQTTEWSGKVVAVLDGDTIEVLHDGQAERIRLAGIDCPEKKQAFGMKAKQFTSDLVYGKKVTVRPKEKDRYGRTIADVFLEDGTWLNKALIDAGYAWHYKAYSKDQVLSNAEIQAKNSKFGLWSDGSPLAPWEFRKAARN
jgi:micrococcal nuclease